MKNPITLLSALFGVGDKTSNEHKKITVSEAKTMMDNKKVIILDVRNKDEYDTGHIPNAILLPLPTIEENAKEILPNKDAVILVHCQSGGRSAKAAKNLAFMGYTNIYDFGGITDWKGKIVQ